MTMERNPPESQREIDPRLVLRGLTKPRPKPVIVRNPSPDPVAVALKQSHIMTLYGEMVDVRSAEDPVTRVRPQLLGTVIRPSTRREHLLRRCASAAPLTVVLAIATFLRLWHLNQIGFNSDEAVYAGTGASMAGHTDFSGMFPVFRAHPLLFQTLISLIFQHDVSDWAARTLAALFGVATVGVTYAVARRMYGPLCGIVAGLFMAVMPYHVVVSRQVLLDGPMTLFATLALYCIMRYCEEASWSWMLAVGGTLSLAVLSKETALTLVGAIYAFFALTPAIPVRVRHMLGGVAVLGLLASVFPIVVRMSGRSGAGNSYLLWQLGRRSNHSLFFYLDVVPMAVGLVTLAAAAGGLIALRRNAESWRERLLLAWIAVPVTFFTLWPLKGYQYLLPIAPAVAILGARGIIALYWVPWLRAPSRKRLRLGALVAAVVITAVTLIVPTWTLVNPSSSGTFLAGTGGVPGGREAGLWLKDNAPEGSQLLSIGPSMANILQFYGQRRTLGLSVSSNPRDRNPAYQPVANPDLSVRDGRVQFVVWDSYTANRTPFFAAKITALARRYHGVAVFTATVPVRTPSGSLSRNPVVIIYQVRPT
jgi:hypothetical protein